MRSCSAAPPTNSFHHPRSAKLLPLSSLVELAMLPRGPLPSSQRSGLRGRHSLPPAPPPIREEVTGGGIQGAEEAADREVWGVMGGGGEGEV